MEDNIYGLKNPAGYRQQIMESGLEDWRKRQLAEGSLTEVPGDLVIKDENIEIIEPDDPRLVLVDRSGRGWDWAKTQGRGDYTVGARIDRIGGRYIIRDVIRGRWDTTNVELQMAIAAQQDGFGTEIGIESAYNSDMWIKGLKNGVLHGFKVKEMDAKITGRQNPNTKIARAMNLIGAINSGMFMMVRGKWNDALIREMRLFGVEKDAPDDQIDGLAYAFKLVSKPPVRIEWVNGTI